MTAKDDDNLPDEELFRKAMQGVTPLKAKNRISQNSSVTRPARLQVKPADISEKPALSDHCPEEILPEQTLSFMKSGVQPRYFRQLKQGRIFVEAELDLHGYTVDTARDLFLKFIQNALDKHYRCIRIIHGKGYRGQSQTPILKSKVFTWLCQLPDILAFSSCQPKDGGTGAVYVLLRKMG